MINENLPNFYQLGNAQSMRPADTYVPASVCALCVFVCNYHVVKVMLVTMPLYM